MNQTVTSTIRALLGGLIGAIFLYLVMHNIDYHRVIALLDRPRLIPLLIALIAFVADFLLRAVRFWMMLQVTTGRRLPLLSTISPFIASFGISDILPLRVGDALRVFWFSQRFQISAGTVVGTMIVERILDLITIVMLGGLALMLLDMTVPSALMTNFKIVLLIAIVGGIILLIAPALLSRMLAKIPERYNFALLGVLTRLLGSTAAAVAQIGSWQWILGLITISLALWLLESVVIFGVWVSLGGYLNEFQKPFLAFAFSTLGTLIPSLPGHFGSYEFFGLQAFSLAGVETSFAAAVLLLTHIILWAPTALFGIGFIFLGRLQKRAHLQK
ncbi:MAG: lysylphosphatidylglycerol synthase transmembrane domain-containing protein [Aestuariivirga sp.]